MQYNWDWSILVQEPYLWWLISGTGWTLAVSAAAWIIAMVLGTLIGVAQTLPNRLVVRLGAAYTEVFRNVPLLVQLFLWYFVAPEILPASVGHWIKRDLPLPEFTTAVIGLGLYTAARVSIQVRTGIQSLRPGLAMAGYAQGMTVAQVYRYMLLPVAFRVVIPPFTTEFLTVFKNSSLALTIGVLELTAQSGQISEYSFHSFEAFTAATAIYILITMTVAAAMALVERRLPAVA